MLQVIDLKIDGEFGEVGGAAGHADIVDIAAVLFFPTFIDGPIQSPALKDFEEEPERWLDVRWDVDESTPQRFPARNRVDNVNEPGSLAQVATVIAEHDGNIDNISMSRRSPDFTELTIDLEVYDLKHLSAIIAQLRAKAVVARVERVNG